MNWRKSTYSDTGGENCVETASGNAIIFVRDTANSNGDAAAVSRAARRSGPAESRIGLTVVSG